MKKWAWGIVLGVAFFTEGGIAWIATVWYEYLLLIGPAILLACCVAHGLWLDQEKEYVDLLVAHVKWEQKQKTHLMYALGRWGG
jgi:hypothetical protein